MSTSAEEDVENEKFKNCEFFEKLGTVFLTEEIDRSISICNFQNKFSW